jgi:hypothetical protein
MTIIKSNRSLKNKDKKFVISRKIIKEFEVKINRLKNDRCGTEVFSVFQKIYNKKVKENNKRSATSLWEQLIHLKYEKSYLSQL